MPLKCPVCNMNGLKSFMSVIYTEETMDKSKTVSLIRCNFCNFEYKAYNTKGAGLKKC